MPLSIVRSESNRALWAACRDRFLERIGDTRGPDGFASHLWIAHSNQRDSLYEEAERRGLPGWLGPPVSFLSELHDRFGIRARPVGHLTGRLLVARIAAREFRRAGLGASRPERGPAGSHAIDRLFSELLPEGVQPDDLRRALDALPGDDFARRRNEWVLGSYDAFLRELALRERYDPRSIHAIVADRIRAGGLSDAIGGAGTLHIYGLTSIQRRRRLFQALAEQDEVEVMLYLPSEPGRSEWDESLAAVDRTEVVPGSGERSAMAYVIPTASREAEWVAGQVKRLVLDGEAMPHEIAIVARSGGEDTRRVVAALAEAGVPCTARVRSSLADVAGLKALLVLFRGAADDWPYRSLRQVLASPYFDLELDLRSLDYIARERRVRGLEQWTAAYERLLESAESEDAVRRLAREGLRPGGLREDMRSLEEVRRELEPLSVRKTETGWIDETLEILAGRKLDFRRRLCEAPAGRWDLVRADQRATEALQVLLHEWREFEPSEETFGVEEWYARLRRFLESNEIALTTPFGRGVQVLEAHQAALTPFRRTFVIHANDGVFPRPHLDRGVFSPQEIGHLKRQGIPLSDRTDTVRRELALWAAVTAQESIAWTSRATGEDGSPRQPSLLIPADVDSTDIPARRRAPGPPDSESVLEEPVSTREQLEREARALRPGRSPGIGDAFPSIDPAALRGAILAAHAEDVRSGAFDADPAFGPDGPISLRPHQWGGLITDPIVLRHLSDRFADGRTWSSSQLEQYGRRPFDFLLDRVLRIQATDEADETTTPASRGSLAHRILDRFFRELGSARADALTGEAATLFDRVAEAVLTEAEAAEDEWLGEPPLWRVTREQVKETVRDFLSRELPRLEKDGAWPVQLEFAFGDDPAPEFVLRGEDLEGRPTAIRVRGRIDRVDAKQRENGIELRVLDYKWKSYPSASGYADGSVLQMPIYMRAVEEASEIEGEVKQGSYRQIDGTTANGAKLKADDVSRPVAFALSIPRRIRDGKFEAVQAKAEKLRAWQPGIEITRTEAAIREGHRFQSSEPDQADG